MANCTKCGSLLKPDRNFCTSCGAPVVHKPVNTLATPIRQQTPAKCAKCGAALKPGRNFCTACRNPIAQTQVTVPPLTQSQARCARCGEPPKPGKQFCRGCGARIIRVGRRPDNDVVLGYPMIAPYHASVTIAADVATIQDLGSQSGTAIGSPDKKIASAKFSSGDTIYFGSFPIPASRLLSGHLNLGKRPHTLLTFSGESMVLGRSPDCDVMLDHPMIAWHHARISRSGEAFTVEELGMTTGTYVNNRRISGREKVKVGDLIRVGSYTFHFTAKGTIKQRDYRGNMTLEAREVAVEVARGKRLIEDISLTIYPSEIVALMGPSGAGKTTLMNALNGYSPPTNGSVFINGQNVYANYEQFCGHLGYVPQDDIMHRDLTVGQALYYTARLRLPPDYSEAAIEARIQSVLILLGLDGTQDVIIGSPEKKGISGGQRKRVNLAMELLTDPSILFLDEPTSGLASEDALMVMTVLREIADSGKTVLITIHQPGLEVFRMMDSLVVLSKDKRSQEPGRLVYFGPAYPDSVEFFNPNGVAHAKPGSDPAPDEVLRGLSQGLTKDWVSRYAASQHKRQYVDERLGKRPSRSAEAVAPKIKRQPGLSQWWTLVKRNLAIKFKDRWSTAILLAQAPVIASLLVLVFGDQASNETAPYLGKTITTIFMLIISALWLGCSNAAREIVSEWAVYHRERMVNLKIPSYVASKVTVLGALSVIQCLTLFTIVYYGAGLQGPFWQMLAVLILASLVATAIGLVLSALARTPETAMFLVPVILLPMIFLGGMLSPLHKMMDVAQPIADVVPARWAFEAMLLLEDENRETKPPQTRAQLDKLAENPGNIPFHFPISDRFGTTQSAAILSGMFVALIAGVMILLKKRDVH